MSYRRFITAAVVAALTAGASASAQANVSYTWTFQDGGAEVTGDSFTSQPPGGPSVTVSGWSWSNAASTGAPAAVHMWNGLGVVNGSELPSDTGPHSTDNFAGYDAVLYSFNEEVSLSSVSLGWNGHDNATGLTYKYNDSDIAVLRYQGLVAPTLQNSSLSSLVADGWEVVGGYGDVGLQPNNTQDLTAQTHTGQTDANGNDIAKYSSWWLVMAYYAFPNATNVGSPDAVTSYVSGGKKKYNIDASKILAIAGMARPLPPSAVPEPATLALLAVGLSVLGWRRAERGALRAA